MQGIIPEPTNLPHALVLLGMFALLGFLVIVAGRVVGGFEDAIKRSAR